MNQETDPQEPNLDSGDVSDEVLDQASGGASNGADVFQAKSVGSSRADEIPF